VEGWRITMLTRVEKLGQELPERNRDIALYAKHLNEALTLFEEHHRKFVAAQSLAGIRPEGEQEASFYQTIQDMREQILQTLQLTVDDLKHKGDKHHDRHFRDGVE
jgi:hypothetical protein